jgi:hypothetical protein
MVLSISLKSDPCSSISSICDLSIFLKVKNSMLCDEEYAYVWIKISISWERTQNLQSFCFPR